MAEPAGFTYGDNQYGQDQPPGYGAPPPGYGAPPPPGFGGPPPPPPGYGGPPPGYGGPPPGYGQQPGTVYPAVTGQPVQQGTVVITTQQQYGEASPALNMMISRVPIQAPCPHCQRSVTTDVELERGPMIWFYCIFICLIFPCLMWLPFVMDIFKDAVHKCPDCHNELGRSRACVGSGGGSRRSRRMRHHAIGHRGIGHGIGHGRRHRRAGRRR